MFANRSPGAAPGWPSPGFGWYAVAILWLSYTLSFIDRQILSLLVPAIQAELSLGDTDLGLLQGIAFGLFYTTLGIPVGWYVDRGNRRNLLIAGVLLWSMATCACGLATGFWSLFSARMLVGVGEAVLSPCAVSILSDCFPREKRALPFSVYVSAGSVGGGLALISGGAVLGLLATVAVEPGGLTPWRLAFIAVGLPGVLLCALLLTLKEPRRHTVKPSELGSHPLAAEPQRAETLWGYLTRRRRLVVGHFGGFGAFAAVSYGVYSWAPALFMRVHEWSATQTGIRFGLGALVGGASGAVVGGLVANRWRRAGRVDASLRTAAIGTTLLIPMTIAASLAANPSVALALFTAVMFLFALPSGVSVSAVAEASPGHLRGQVTAVYYLAMSLVGLSIGPLAVAVLTEHVFGDPAAVGRAMALSTVVLGGASIVLLWWAVPAFREAVTEEQASAAD